MRAYGAEFDRCKPNCPSQRWKRRSSWTVASNSTDDITLATSERSAAARRAEYLGLGMSARSSGEVR